MCRVSEGETEAANGEASGRSSSSIAVRREEGAPLLRFVHLNLLPDPNDERREFACCMRRFSRGDGNAFGKAGYVQNCKKR